MQPAATACGGEDFSYTRPNYWKDRDLQVLSQVQLVFLPANGAQDVYEEMQIALTILNLRALKT